MSHLLTDELKAFLRDELRAIIRAEFAIVFQDYAASTFALSDGRRKLLTAKECKAKYGVGNDTLTSLRQSKKVRATLSPGHGRGGKVWRYSAADVEAAIGVKS